MSEPQQHWADHKERGSFWLMKFTAFGIKLLGRRLLTPVLYGIVLYFFVFGRRARHSIRDYQQHLADWSGQSSLRPPCSGTRSPAIASHSPFSRR